MTDAELARVYSEGKGMAELATLEGTNKMNIHRRLKRFMLAGKGDGAYADLVTEVLVNRVSDADEMLEEAVDQVEVTKARETARFARMDFERRRPHLYGQKQEVVHTAVPTFTVVLLDKASVTPVAVLEEKVVNEERDEDKVEAIAGPAERA